MPTNTAIRVDFDRPVDRQSVATRFSLQPAASGRITWPSAREFLFVEQAPLRTDTTYRVLLRAGYRSAGGGAADLDHTWSFKTEGALQVTDSSPSPADRGVDPAAYLAVSFNHRMSASALRGAFDISPALPLQATLAPGDPYRVVIAPAGLLAASANYTLTVSTDVRDADGNPLPKPVSVRFQTGPIRPLHGWLTCLASAAGTSPAAGGDLWMVDQNRLPRELLAGPFLAYYWAPAADELTVETGQRTWEDRRLDGSVTPISISADAVIPVGGGLGFVYFDHGTLGLLSAAGQAQTLAQGVSQLAVSPDGRRVVYTVPGAAGTELWALSVELRSRFELGTEAGAISGLAWSPDSSRLAYQLTTSRGDSIRVRVLADPAPVTVATDGVSDPAWDADASHLYLLAARGTPALERLYRIPTGSGLQTLSPGTALPTPPGLRLSSPEPSPDGHQVAFAGVEPRGQEVWLMNSDGTGLGRLTGGADYAYSCLAPMWTPPA